MTLKSNHEAAPHALIARAVIWKDGRLLANRARNAAGEAYAALPGGHVDPGEDCKFALAREMEEELLARVTVGELLFVAEAKYLGGKRGDKPRHEVVLFFEAELQNELEEIDGRLASPEPQKNFGWLSPEDWGALNLVPHALRAVLAGNSTQRYDFRDMMPAATNGGAS
jgi:ADP-ribose pyrophosphatase YjhB (NUDIX family)